MIHWKVEPLPDLIRGECSRCEHWHATHTCAVLERVGLVHKRVTHCTLRASGVRDADAVIEYPGWMTAGTGGCYSEPVGFYRPRAVPEVESCGS